jgi:putative ABC transport system permease protein
MTLRDTVGLAFQALRGNLLRSVLTALGVIIGIAAVIVMVAIGQGTQSRLDAVISSLGSNRLEVQSGAGRSGGARMGAGSKPTLTQGDADAIRRELPEVQYVAASVRLGGTQAVSGDANWSTSLQGVEEDFFAINNWQLDTGEWFQQRDFGAAAKVVLIGQTVKKNLFGDEDPVGKTIRVERVPLRVGGVLRPRGQGGFGQDNDDVMFVPLQTAKRRLPAGSAISGEYVQQISVGVSRPEAMSSVQASIADLLRQRHRIAGNAQDDFNVRNMAEIIQTRTETTRLMSILLGAVATISLIVGGIGIMNIMLVSVTERIREIGLRMAVGAGPREIQRQFLAEALAISLGGGVLGILLGIAGALIFAAASALPVSLSVGIIALATLFALATGLFFGYYPAKKAAELDPIEALRSE